MSDAQTGAPALTGNVLLYKNPEPLSLEGHNKLGLKNIERPFGFVETTHVVPLTVQEFGMAATSLPIIFAPDRKTPLAVLSARSGENLYVDATGNWELDGYIPAFIRRYPFVFAADQQGDNFVVCIDTQAEMIGENPDLPLFENGQPTAYTTNAMEFLQDFERQRRATEEFMEVINSMDILEEKSVTFTPTNADGSQGEPVKVADYIGVSEEKLNALPAAKLLELKQKGCLGAIYAHLVSLLHWQKLIQRTLRNAPPEVVAGNA
ncbi:MAG: SapC family protein [Hyphomonadaceae bacterium]